MFKDNLLLWYLHLIKSIWNFELFLTIKIKMVDLISFSPIWAFWKFQQHQSNNMLCMDWWSDPSSFHQFLKEKSSFNWFTDCLRKIFGIKTKLILVGPLKPHWTFAQGNNSRMVEKWQHKNSNLIRSKVKNIVNISLEYF